MIRGFLFAISVSVIRSRVMVKDFDHAVHVIDLSYEKAVKILLNHTLNTYIEIQNNEERTI